MVVSSLNGRGCIGSMDEAVLEVVRKGAERMGGCAPQWLKENRPPEFNVVEAGTEGPHVLLLHGLLGALSNWDSILPIAAKYSRLTALQFPILTGHRSEVRVKSLAAYTECYIRTRCEGPVVLCGNSLGGHVALRVALTSPELVDCLVLSGASGLYEHSVDTLPVRPKGAFIREHMARVFCDTKFITDEAVDNILEILSSRVNHLNLIHAARSAKRDNLLQMLDQVEAPTLLLWGEEDEVTTMSVAKIFHSRIPNSILVTKERCGHAPMIEHPQWFSDEMEKFLREHSRYYNHNSHGKADE